MINWARERVADTIDWLVSRETVSARLRERLLSELPASQIPGFQCVRWSGARDDANVVHGAVFVTSRFRSGSTLLWRCFRESDNFTAYYEPLNPRRWFDRGHRGSRVDSTHRQVTDYWREYSHLEEIEVPWQERWCSSDLYLPPVVPALTLFRYINLLITTSPQRPVLQFNRIDFRLHWLRRRYPTAFFVHLYRNPRDQWISTFLKGRPVGKDARVADFQPHDEFYLLPWLKDLRRYFPVLSEVDRMHPYEASYLLWRLSGVYARAFCDHHVFYDDFVNHPKQTLAELGDALGVSGLDSVEPVASIDARSVGRWRQYDNGSWFREREQFVDQLLQHCMEIQPPCSVIEPQPDHQPSAPPSDIELAQNG